MIARYEYVLTSGIGPQLNSWAIQYLLCNWWFENVPSLLKFSGVCHHTGATQMLNPLACVKP